MPEQKTHGVDGTPLLVAADLLGFARLVRCEFLSVFEIAAHADVRREVGGLGVERFAGNVAVTAAKEFSRTTRRCCKADKRVSVVQVSEDSFRSSIINLMSTGSFFSIK